MKRIVSLFFAILVCVTSTAPALANQKQGQGAVSPKGNLASIYKSDTPYYGTSSTYRILESVDEYNVELREELASYTAQGLIALLTLACPPLGAAVGGTWEASEGIEYLYEYLQALGFFENEDETTEHVIYVRVKCYVPPVQPTPEEVLYSKYVIEYYTDSEYEDFAYSDEYYQKLVYNLH